MTRDKLRALDLFAGVGGFRAGALMTGLPIEFVAFGENDVYPSIGYYAMFGEDESNLGDIKAITRVADEEFSSGFLKPKRGRTMKIRAKIPDHDLLLAGFPCQAFSKMGAEGGVNDALGRGDLLFDLVEILRVKRPEYFVFENVDGFATHEDGTLLKKTLDWIGKKIGYSTAAWRLNAADYETVQTRNRVFIVGRLGRRHNLSKPKPKPLSGYAGCVHSILDKTVEDKYYLSDKILPTILSNGTGGWKAKAEINMSPARPLCKTMHKMHRASQDNYYSDDYITGTWDESTESIHLANVPNRIRKITPNEAFRIQGFKQDLIDKLITSGLSDTRLYMAAGNAVPPPLVKNVLDSLLFEKSQHITLQQNPLTVQPNITN